MCHRQTIEHEYPVDLSYLLTLVAQDIKLLSQQLFAKKYKDAEFLGDPFSIDINGA
jgi:hypothetical protein